MDESRTTDNLGGGGVHSHVGVQPSKGEGMSGKFDSGTGTAGQGSGGGAMDNARDRAGEVADQAREQVGNATDQVRERMDDVRGRAEEMVGQARNRVSGMLDQAQDSQPVQMARDNPLPALGIAFALGFLLAGSSDTGGRMGKAKQQVRGAVMGGISAALAQELRNMVGMQGGGKGAGGLLSQLMGNAQGGGGQGQQSSGTGSQA